MAFNIAKNIAVQGFTRKPTLWYNLRCFSKGTSDSKSESTVNVPSKSKVTNLPPMDVPVPGLPKPIYATLREEHQSTQVTVLPNGLRVASEDKFGEFCTIGVIVDSGSRHEVAYPSGISHFLEKLAFNSTAAYGNKDDMMIKLEKQGGICDSQASRDTFIYAASAYTKGLPEVMEILSEVTLRPRITEDEIQAAAQAIIFEWEMLNMRPEQEVLLMDMIHAAAYRDNTLGLPKLCPEKNVNKISRNMLYTYLNNHYVPERMVIAGVGVDHNALVSAAQNYFVSKPPIWISDENLVSESKTVPIDDSVVQYTGGMVKEECDIPQFAAAGLPVLSHVMIGLEGCSHQDDDFIAMCVLNMMMGGGGSFSAGGPGKGMYTRLYTNVLNRYHWMYSATAYNHAYADSGIFCIHASAPPTHVREMVEVIVREMVNMAGPISGHELRRAKTQLQSMLLMNLESRPVVFEDIGRQVLATGQRKRPEHFIQEIEKITKEDIVNVAKKLLGSPPAVAARGDLKKLPSLEYIQAGLLDAEGRIPGGRKLSLFR